ncbi:hypothetical protein BGX33_005202 [Mortierella sp. NVP41]|nr:hypothetical protein BGX33_005202 [Mortierella sp. NVP41]
MIVRADSGDHHGQVVLGDMYREGRGVVQDFAKAREWYLKAAEAGYLKAQVQLGSMCFYGGGSGVGGMRVREEVVEMGLDWFRKAAAQGDTLSRMIVQASLPSSDKHEMEVTIGDMYREGKEDVAQDSERAMFWYLKAAEEGGHARAQYNVGFMLHYGEGVPKDLRKSLEWYKKAAAQGDGLAEYKVQSLRRDGLTPLSIAAVPDATLGVVVEDQLVETATPSASSTVAQSPEPHPSSSSINTVLSDTSFTNDDPIHSSNTPISSQHNAATTPPSSIPASTTRNYSSLWETCTQRVMVFVKTIPKTWIITSRRLSKGRRRRYSTIPSPRIRLVASSIRTESRVLKDLGELGALFLEFSSFDGSQSDSRAVKATRQMAQRGDMIAQYRLGSMYLSGEGVKRNFTKAAEWFLEAAEQGHTDA